MAISITGYFDNEGAETGFFLPGSVTDDASPLLQGTVDSLNAGDSIYILRDGQLLARVNDVNPATGTWSFQDSGLANDGHAYTYQVWVLSAMGLPTAISNTCSITWRDGGTPPPPPPTPTIQSVWDDKGASTGVIDNNGRTDDDTPTLKGILSAALAAGQSLHIFRGATDVGVVTVAAGSTNWEFTDSGLANGDYNYTAKVMAGGAVLKESSVYAITVGPDIVNPPTQTTTLLVWDDKAPVVGWVNNGDTTNDDTPTLQGVLSAPLMAGQSLQIVRNGVVLDTIRPTGTEWSYTDFELTSMTTYNYAVSVVNQANQAGTAARISFTYDGTPPQSAVNIEGIFNNNGGGFTPVFNNEFTNDKTPVLTIKFPTLNTGDQLFLVRDGTPIAITPPTGAVGSFNYEDSALGDGRHTYAVRLVFADPAAIPRELNSATWTINIDTIAPTAPVVALAHDTGVSATDNITSDGTLNVTGTEPGAKVEYSINGGTTWSTSFHAAEGQNTVQVRQTDKAGNVSPPASLTFTLDTTAPTAPTVALANDTGSSATDKITRDGTLNVTGTETGATVQYSTNGGATWSTSFAAVEGQNIVQVRQLDVAGNHSTTSSITFTLDTTAPAAPTVALLNDTGIPGDLITTDGRLNVTGLETDATVEYSINGGTTWSTSFTAVEGVNAVQVRQTDVAGNHSTGTNFTFTLDGKPSTPHVALLHDTGRSATDNITREGELNVTGLETGATVQYSIDGGATWTAGFHAVEGLNTVQVRQVSVAGTPSDAASITFTLDTTAPAIPHVALANDTGASATDLITSDGTLNVTRLETDAIVEYSTDGGATWTTGFHAVEGVNTVQVHQVDVAGNASDPTGITFTLDTTAPTGNVRFTGYVDDFLPITGTFGNNTTTNDTTPLLQGQVNGLVSGDVVRIYNKEAGGALTLIGQATVTGSNWEYQVPDSSPLAIGDYRFVARLEDVAGNIGPISTNQLNLTVEGDIDPTRWVRIDTIWDDVGPVTGGISSGAWTNDSTPTLIGRVGIPLTGSQYVAIYRTDVSTGATTLITTLAFPGVSWDFTDTTGGMLNGHTYTYMARVENSAGATGLWSNPYNMHLDLGGYLTINPIAGNDVLDATEAAGNVTLSGTLENMPTSTTSMQVQVNVGGVIHNANIFGTTWSLTVSGSELLSATSGARGNVSASLHYSDNMGVSASWDANRGYMLHVEQPPVSVYVVNTAKAGLGYSMSAIGDFNGDGYTDYIVSAPATRYINATLGAPAANYVLYGGPSGLPGTMNLEAITAAQGFKITNSNTGGHFSATNVPGGTVTDIGDFNGDGLSDIAMISPIDNSVRVIFGQAGTPWSSIDLARLTPSQGFTIRGATGFLYGVTGLDVNGDGYSDLIFSDPTAGPKVQNVTSGMGGGAAYVIYGHAGTQGNINTTGNSSSSNGPTDGNSITLVGAGTMGVGYTVLTSVGAQNLGTGYNVGGNPNNNSGYTGLGTVVSAVGDVNGDGYQDFVITAPGGQNWGSSAPGSAYVVFGGPNSVVKGGTVSMSVLDNMAAHGQGFKITATNLYEFLGGKKDSGGPEGRGADAAYGQYHSLSGLGNIDGSGKNAFAIGSPGAINPSTGGEYRYPGLYSDGAGAVYVLYGDSTSLSNITLPTYSGGKWNNLSGLTNAGGFVIYSKTFAATANGTVPGASDLGFAVSSAGDVNGDGLDDFLIGAPMANNSKGAVFLVFGTTNKADLWGTDGYGNPTPGVVDLDKLVADGKTEAFGAPGTAVQYNGTFTNVNSTYTGVVPPGGGTGSNMGTDVTGGDYNGTGIHGYTFSSWGDNGQTGQVFNYQGITALLTQPMNNANGAVYYANSGVDLIATGTGNNVWVHNIGGWDDPSTNPLVQHDAVTGGKGSDFVGIVNTNFTTINGGSGTDTVVFEGSNIKLNLTTMGLKVQGFEQFDLNNQTHTAAGDPYGWFNATTHNNTLELRVSDVLSQMNDAGSGQRMTVMGDNTSTVMLDGGGWMNTSMTVVGGQSFAVWHNTTMGSNTTADLLIQASVHVTMY